MLTEAAMTAALRASVDAFNRRDWEASRRLFDPDIVYATTFSSCVGVEAVVVRYRELTTAVPDLHIERPSIISIDQHDRCAVFGFTQTGTIAQELRTPVGILRGEGEPFTVQSIHVIGFTEAGLISEIRANVYREPASPPPDEW
jgi:hypothetical protein